MLYKSLIGRFGHDSTLEFQTVVELRNELNLAVIADVEDANYVFGFANVLTCPRKLSAEEQEVLWLTEFKGWR